MLKSEIGLDLVDNYDELEKLFGEKLTERTMEEFKRQAGILGESVIRPEKLAHSIVNASFHNAEFSDRIWSYHDVLKSDPDKILSEALIQGLHPRDFRSRVMPNIRDNVKNKNYAAMRLLATELCRVQIDAQAKSYERNGYESYKYLAEPTACPHCKVLDNKVFRVEKMVIGENAPPMHPNCRCSTTAYFDDTRVEPLGADKKDVGGFKVAQGYDGLETERPDNGERAIVANTKVNLSNIYSSEYKRKIDQAAESNVESRNILKAAKEILKHRSGTFYEDLAYIKGGIIKINKSFDYHEKGISACKENKAMKKLRKSASAHTIIGIHNHPRSSVPSITDIKAARDKKYKYGIVLCHNGIVYKYKIKNRSFDEIVCGFRLENLGAAVYNNNKREVKEYLKKLEEIGIEMEVI